MIWSIYFIFAPFTLIGAVMAYLIFYNEYQHHYQTKKEPKQIALDAAIFTFVVLSIALVVSLYLIFNFIEK